MRHKRLKARFCFTCYTAYRNGVLVPLERVSSVLAHLRDDTGLDLPRVPAPKPLARRACEVVGPRWCSGPVQNAHFFAQEDHAHHPLLHHPDNIFTICRSHHRRIDQRRTGYDFAGPALRMNEPPGRQGRLSLSYAFWTLENVKPTLWEKAFKVGILLEARIGERRVEPKDTTVPVSLFYAWLHKDLGNAAGIRAFKNVIYRYDEWAYRPPGPNGEGGDSRTYFVDAEVVRRIQAGQHLELQGDEVRYVMAFLLQRRGHTLNEISRQLRRHKERLRTVSTVSGWVKRGRDLIEGVMDVDDIVLDAPNTTSVESPTSAHGVQINAKLDSRGKLTIPAATRRAIGVRVGEWVRLEVERLPDSPGS